MAKKVTKATKDKEVEVVEELETTEQESPEEVAEKEVAKDEAVAEAVEEEAVEEIPVATVGQEARVKIKVNKDLDSYIGNQYYRFKAGEEYNVPKNVKDVLMGAGYLEAI